MGYILHKVYSWRSPKDEAAWIIFFAQGLLLRSPKDGASWDIFCTGLIAA